MRSIANNRRYSCLTFILCLLQGFDEFMNLVIDEAAEVFVKDAKPRRELGAYWIYGAICIG